MSEKRACWRNCAQPVDDEVRGVDRMEDRLVPLAPGVVKIRALITALELCHHKAGRWVDNILEAIATGQTDKGMQVRAPVKTHSAVQLWRDACAALRGWCEAHPPGEQRVGHIPVRSLYSRLGEPTPLKRWQVRRAAERIHSFVRWAETGDYSAVQYTPILEAGEGYVSAVRTRCPEQYLQQEEQWRVTTQTLIHDTAEGKPATIPLGMAIDLLMPCHWNFQQNLLLVLGAIGGDLHPKEPYTACGGRNMALSPLAEPMEGICATLGAFCHGAGLREGVDPGLLRRLGEYSDEKAWLAASLDKTIRLQLGL